MDSTLNNLKEKIASLGGTVSEQDKIELNKLVQNLQEELVELAETDNDKARRLSSVVDNTADQALQGDADNVQTTIDDFATAIEKLEVTHPKLTDIVNRLCKMLADIGI